MTAPKVSLEKVATSMTLTLPAGVNLKVKEGQKIKEGQVIAQRKASSQIKSYHLNKLLGISPKKTIKSLVKKIGEKVKEGEVIAKKDSFLGKSEVFTAPLEGILDSLTEDGLLKIRKEISLKEIKAPFAGRVKMASSDSVSLSFAALEIKGSWGVGNKKTGYLKVIEEDGDLFSLDEACREQIIVFREKLTKGAWYKATSLGAIGLVANGLVDKSLEKMIEEDNSIAVLIFDGDEQIFQEIWQELKKADGKMALIDGEQKRLLVSFEK